MKQLLCNLFISAVVVTTVTKNDNNKIVTNISSPKNNVTQFKNIADTTPLKGFVALQEEDRQKSKDRFERVKHGNAKKLPAWAAFSPHELRAIANTENLDSVKFFVGTRLDNEGNDKKSYPIILVQLKIRNVDPNQPGILPNSFTYKYYSTTAICPPPYNSNGAGVKLEY